MLLCDLCAHIEFLSFIVARVWLGVCVCVCLCVRVFLSFVAVFEGQYLV